MPVSGVVANVNAAVASRRTWWSGWPGRAGSRTPVGVVALRMAAGLQGAACVQPSAQAMCGGAGRGVELSSTGGRPSEAGRAGGHDRVAVGGAVVGRVGSVVPAGGVQRWPCWTRVPARLGGDRGPFSVNVALPPDARVTVVLMLPAAAGGAAAARRRPEPCRSRSPPVSVAGNVSVTVAPRDAVGAGVGRRRWCR